MKNVLVLFLSLVVLTHSNLEITNLEIRDGEEPGKGKIAVFFSEPPQDKTLEFKLLLEGENVPGLIAHCSNIIQASDSAELVSQESEKISDENLSDENIPNETTDLNPEEQPTSDMGSTEISDKTEDTTNTNMEDTEDTTDLENTEMISDLGTTDMINSDSISALRRLNKAKKGMKTKKTHKNRKLQGEEETTDTFCYFIKPDVEGTYTVTIFGESEVSIPQGKQLDVQAAEVTSEMPNPFITFWQINEHKSEEVSYTFNFFGLTTSPIEIDFSFIFQLYITINLDGNSLQLLDEAICSPEEAVSVNEGDIAVVQFICQFNFDKIGGADIFSSLVIKGSSEIGGIPNNETLLDPVAVDNLIQSHSLDKISKTSEPPKILKDVVFNFDNIESTGNFEIEASLEGVELTKDQKYEFSFPLAFPAGIEIFCEFTFTDSPITITCSIEGTIENQKLVFEQRIISIEGKEVFVFPGKETDKEYTFIAKEDEESEVNELNEDSSEEQGENAEGEDKEVIGEENEPEEGGEGKEPEESGEGKEPEEGGEEKEPEVMGEEKEPEESGEGKEPEESGEGKEGEDIEDEEEVKENEEPKEGNATISFRQVNGFNIDEKHFIFYGLTTEIIEINYEFIFEIFFILTDGKPFETPGESICTTSEGAPEIPEEGIAQVVFQCSFEIPTGVTIESLEIKGSETIIGIPTDANLINPKLTDDGIQNGDIKAINNESPVPPLLKELEFNFEKIEEGSLEIEAVIGECDLGAGEKYEFSIPLLLPAEMLLTCSFTFNGSPIHIKCGFEGDFSGNELAFEQRLIIVGGTELFILPGNSTEITPDEGEGEQGEGEQSEAAEGEQGEAAEGEQGEATEGEQGEAAEGEKGEAAEGEQGEAAEGEQGEADEGEQSEAAEGEQGEAPEGEQGEAAEGEQGEATEGEQGEATEGEQGEAAEGEQGEATEGEKGEATEGEQGKDEQGEGEQGEGEEGKDEQGEHKEGEQGEGEAKEDEQGKDEQGEEGKDEQGESEKESKEEESSSSATTSTDKVEESTDTEKQPETQQQTAESGELPIEEAEKIAEIALTFRQLNNFKFTLGQDITFNFYALTSVQLEINYVITLIVNLIGPEGMEESTKEANCKLKKAIPDPNGAVLPADFECSISKDILTPNVEYISFRLNSTEQVAGIPTEDEVALNPVLTDEAIKKEEITDVSKVEVPPTFVLTSINQDTCSQDGKFTIIGKFSKSSSIVTKFTIPLTYPEGKTITCNANEENLECITDRDIDDENIIIEQTVVKNGDEELFILASITDQKLKCGNGLLKEAQEKVNVDISFRQVSKIKQETKGFSFFFAAFINSRLAAKFEMMMKMIVIINKEKVEKNATCVLREDVNPSGEPIQGDFDCNVILEDSEKNEMDMSDPEAISVSPDNNEIGGCAELSIEEASPKATDEAIENSKKAESDLSVVLDYSIAENKDIKPPAFEIEGFETNQCSNKGKIKVKGKLTGTFTKKIDFELPFTFPASKIKCSIEKESDTEITCKVQKGFKEVKSLVFEPRLLKKKRREVLFIRKKSGAQFNFGDLRCENFNELKKAKAIQAKKADFNLLQIGRPRLGFNHFFFMALTRKKPNVLFVKRTFRISITYVRSRMRLLEDLSLDLNVDCSPDVTTENSGSFNCDSSFNGEPLTVELPSEDISTPTDEVEILEDPKPNLSEKTELEAIDNLTMLNITELDYSSCSQTGEYTIKASYVSDNKLPEAKYDNITIPFSNPDSSGLCQIEASNEVTIKCHSTEEFSATEVIIPSQVIYDKDDTTPLFKISDDVTRQFSCVIGDLSEKNTTNATTPESTSESSGQKYFKKDSSSGLTGGAIAGIVIACVAVVGIAGFLVSLVRKGTFSGPSNPGANTSVDNSSTINRFNINPQGIQNV